MENTGAHIGLVTAITDGTAQIHFLRSSACAHCGACLTVGDTEMEVSLPNTLGAKEGDRVVVDLSPKRVVQASLLAYAVPLLLLIAGVLIGSQYAACARRRRLDLRAARASARGQRVADAAQRLLHALYLKRL